MLKSYYKPIYQTLINILNRLITNDNEKPIAKIKNKIYILHLNIYNSNALIRLNYSHRTITVFHKD